MFSLFISFDIMISFLNQYMYWFTAIFVFIFNLGGYFFTQTSMLNNLMLIFTKEFMVSTKIKSFLNLLIFVVVFVFILFINFMGMWPYFFTFTSQLNFCFFFCLTLWLTVMMNNIFKGLNLFIPHLVPSGSPIILSQFMVLIETISQIIRPLTLGVRLMANMTAGHLIMILCSSPIMFLGLISFPLILLILLEFMVAFIQSYVFVILMSMYTGEFNN